MADHTDVTRVLLLGVVIFAWLVADVMWEWLRGRTQREAEAAERRRRHARAVAERRASDRSARGTSRER